MSPADHDPILPFNEAIETDKLGAGQTPREFRYQALGGLSIAKTSLAVEV